VSTPPSDRRDPAQGPEPGTGLATVPESGRVSTAIGHFSLAGVIGALIALVYGLGLHHEISFEALIRNRTAVDRFIAENMVAAVAGYIALYIALIGLFIPSGAVMRVIGGFLFGPVIGTIAAVASALAGGTIIFFIARGAAGEWLTRRAGPAATRFTEGFRADAFSYLLFLRLMPLPFWLVNISAALFGVRFSTFIAASALGILPATVAYAVFGAGLGGVIAVQEAEYKACIADGLGDCAVDFDLSQVLTPALLLALAGLAVLALVPPIARRIFGRMTAVPVKRL
jgi:uncharacterized membrane protein YdjX (TVP38/TMEM64 family)